MSIDRLGAHQLSSAAVLYADGSGPQWSFLERLFQQPHARSWVFCKSEIIACAWFSVIETEAELIDIRVLSHHQGTGIGRRLLSKALDELGSERVSTVYLEVRESNVAAQKLYTRLGFLPEGRRAAYYPTIEGREDAVLMRKTIEAS